jgi:broad specificity phosphatase PhoE
MVKIYFLRHAQTEHLLSASPNQWKLSKNGFLQARQLKQKFSELIEAPFDLILCSEELKTYQTVYPYAKSNSIRTEKWGEFNEANSHISPEPNYSTFLETKRAFFLKITPAKEDDFNLFSSDFEEHPLIALQRFRSGIYQIQQRKSLQNVLICTHGTVLSLFWGWQMDKLEHPEEIYNFWQNFPFCGLGIWKDDKFITNFHSLLEN